MARFFNNQTQLERFNFMCKILALSGINSGNRVLALEFIHRMASIMTPSNNDGLGYAAISEDGEHFGERWHHNGEAFKVRENDALTQAELAKARLSRGAWVPKKKPLRYDSRGKLSLDKLSAITLHTRFATSEKVFRNTHPFWHDGVSLIHNGVIGNADDIGLINSTCDSEAILNLYTKHNVRKKPRNIAKLGESLDGYYACAVLSKNSGKAYLDVFKDRRASLSVVSTDKLGDIYSTKEDDILRVIEEINSRLPIDDKVKIVGSFTVSPGHLIRHDVLTGNIILTQKFEPEFKPKPVKYGIDSNRIRWNNLESESSPVNNLDFDFSKLEQAWNR